MPLLGQVVGRYGLVVAVLAEVAATDVARDGAEPGVSTRWVDELRPVSPGLEECLLCHVLRRGRADDCSAQPYEPGALRGRPRVDGVVGRQVQQCGQRGSSGCVGDH